MMVTIIICNVYSPLSAGCPSNMVITPSTGPYEAGDMLTCSADGYNPTYKWTGIAGVAGDLVSETGPTYTLPGGPFNVICTATVTELACCDSVTLSDIYSKYQQEIPALPEKTARCRCKF